MNHHWKPKRRFTSPMLWAFSAAWLLIGCGDDNSNPSTCVAGSQIACACPGAPDGVQVCNAAGSYGACECGGDRDSSVIPDIQASDSQDGDSQASDATGSDANADAAADGAGPDGANPDSSGSDSEEPDVPPADVVITDGTAGDEPTAENPTPGCYRAPTMTENDTALPAPPFPGRKRVGEACTFNEECQYGYCATESVVTQGAFSVCLKKCGDCGAVPPACSWDDGDPAGAAYTCVKTKFDGVNQSHCARRCSALSDCSALSPDYTSCNSSSAGKKYCGGL